jgi:hypothetical protein
MRFAHSRIAVPGVGENVLLGLAGVGVDNLDINPERHTSLVFSDVGADILARDICSSSVI